MANTPIMTVCLACGEETLRERKIPYTLDVVYEGKNHPITIPRLTAEVCASCGEVFLDNRADHEINRALRNHLQLLQPEEIVARRKKLKLSQQQLADMLQIAGETLCRWERDRVIQSRAHDLLLRLFFEQPSRFMPGSNTRAFSYSWENEISWHQAESSFTDQESAQTSYGDEFNGYSLAA